MVVVEVVVEVVVVVFMCRVDILQEQVVVIRVKMAGVGS